MQESDTFQLVMGRGPRPGQIFELPRSTVSIGRDAGNNVAIKDPQISRQHARITPQGGLMVLEDLGSTNGTTVNGLRISGPHALAQGDEVGLGDNVTLIFYGRPASDAGETVMSPRAAYASPPSADAMSAQQSAPPPAYASPPSAHPPLAPDYDQVAVEDDEYYEAYPEERNWTLIAMGCILVAIIIILLLAVFIYFFAPASIVDPIADFLATLGITVP